MTVVRLRVRLEDEAEAEAVAAQIEERLAPLEGVDEVSAAPERPQGMADVLMAVTAAVAITRGGRDAIVYVRQALNELRGLVDDWRGSGRTVLVEVEDEEVDVRDVGEREVAAIAAEED
jgi:hypothetical protein